MPTADNLLLTSAARLAYLPFRLLARRSFAPPRRALILKPYYLSQVMLTTPLLAALSDAYPEARFDWAVSEWSRPAVCANPRLTELVDTGHVGLPGGEWADVNSLIDRLRAMEYDTCFIPSRSSLLTYVAWRAGIPQRIGLRAGGRGFAHTTAVPSLRVKRGERVHEASQYLALAGAAEAPEDTTMEFHPTDVDRATATRLLTDELGWSGAMPLVLLHPGGGLNPVRPDERKQWPAERYALLGNHLTRVHGACVLLVGATEDQPAAAAVSGMMSTTVPNLAGRLSLGELGALAEVADLYVGNDTGPTHVAAAVGCPTLALFGPTDPAVSRPYPVRSPVTALGGAPRGPFSWSDHLPAGEVVTAADALLAAGRERPASR